MTDDFDKRVAAVLATFTSLLVHIDERANEQDMLISGTRARLWALEKKLAGLTEDPAAKLDLKEMIDEINAEFDEERTFRGRAE